MYQLAFLVGRTFGREGDDVRIPGFDHEPDLEACLEHLESDFGHAAQCHAGYGMLYVQKYPRFLYIALKRDAGAARSTGYAFRQLGARHRVG